MRTFCRRPPQFFNFIAKSASPHLTADHLWKDDPESAYGKFLQWADKMVICDVRRNQHLRLAHKLFKELPVTFEPNDTPEVSVDEGFYDFKTLLSKRLYCSKITIQNFENTDFYFEFHENNFCGTLMIEVPDEIEVPDGKCPDFKIARRTILPAEYSQGSQGAGMMGYHEYLLDGNNTHATNAILLRANSVYPIKIVLENCKGCYVSVRGLDQGAIDRIFTVIKNPNCNIAIEQFDFSKS